MPRFKEDGGKVKLSILRSSIGVQRSFQIENPYITSQSPLKRTLNFNRNSLNVKIKFSIKRFSKCTDPTDPTLRVWFRAFPGSGDQLRASRPAAQSRVAQVTQTRPTSNHSSDKVLTRTWNVFETCFPLGRITEWSSETSCVHVILCYPLFEVNLSETNMSLSVRVWGGVG